MKRIITFLGSGPIWDTTYMFGSVEVNGRVFPEALRAFGEFDEMIVCVTRKAEETNWHVLEQLNDARIRKVPIDNGVSTAEIWNIFSQIVRNIEHGDTVVFDITHGLRSLPFIVYMVASYLKSARSVTIEATYYGALDLRHEYAGKAPVIDLSQLTGLLDWMMAYENLRTTGDARRLAQLIEAASEGQREKIRNRIVRLSDSLQAISEAMLSGRADEMIRRAGEICGQIVQCERLTVERLEPFKVVSRDLLKLYERFALPASGSASGIDEVGAVIERQRLLVDWYIQGQHLVQAALLLRELVMTIVLDSQGLPVKGKRVRKEQTNPRPPLLTSIDLKHHSYSIILGQLWRNLTSVRNPLAHPGMAEPSSSTPRSSADQSKASPSDIN